MTGIQSEDQHISICEVSASEPSWKAGFGNEYGRHPSAYEGLLEDAAYHIFIAHVQGSVVARVPKCSTCKRPRAALIWSSVSLRTCDLCREKQRLRAMGKRFAASKRQPKCGEARLPQGCRQRYCSSCKSSARRPDDFPVGYRTCILCIQRKSRSRSLTFFHEEDSWLATR